MRRLLVILLLLVAGCGSEGSEPLPDARAAEPQSAVLNWRESYPKTGERLVFGVRSLAVTADGWSSRSRSRTGRRSRSSSGMALPSRSGSCCSRTTT